MILPPVYEFGEVTVHNPGIAGQERIIFRPTERLNLAEWGMLLGWQDDDSIGLAMPIRDDFFWFGELEIHPPSWVVLFTGEGEFKTAQDPVKQTPVYCFYWGRKSPIFKFRELVPVLFKMGAVSIGRSTVPLPAVRDILQLPAPA